MKASTEKYYEGIGRRKSSIARVRLWVSSAAKNSFVINDRDLKDYFDIDDLRSRISAVLVAAEAKDKFKVSVKVTGGGINSQADAVVLGVARALIEYDQELRKSLKKEGYLSRDSRVKERRKFGLKKARKAPQWSKR